MDSELPKAMESFFKKHVVYDLPLMKENKTIAEDFVIHDLLLILKNAVQNLPLSVGGIERQGSAFEELKVGVPNEFDFAIQYRIKNCRQQFVFVEGRTIGASLPQSEMAAGYWKIELKSSANAAEWSKLTDQWPQGGKQCLSPRKIVEHLQSAMDRAYPNQDVNEKLAAMSLASGDSRCEATDRGTYWCDRVKNIQRSVRGNPALTISMTKKDGSVIDVDISPCIIDEDDRHFVPKRHPKLSGKSFNPTEPYELLWMRTESQKEKDRICKIDSDGGERRKCMRVLKAALAIKENPFKQFHSSYIVKTAWLHVVDQNPSREKWKGWELLASRMRDILIFLEEAFRQKKLLSRFNPQENILARLSDTFLSSCEGYLKSLNNKLRSGDTRRFITDLGLDL